MRDYRSASGLTANQPGSATGHAGGANDWAFKHRSNRCGAAMVVLVLLLPVVLAVASFCINVAYMELVRTELQTTTDLATRAAGRTLAATGDEQLAIKAAERVFSANTVGGSSAFLDARDVVFGVSTRLSAKDRYQFTKGANPNAVRIDSGTNGVANLPLIFPTLGVPIDFQPIKSAISTQTELDVALVLDRSGSMAFAADEPATSGVPLAAPAGWKFGNPVPPNSRWLDTVVAVRSFIGLLEVSNHSERVTINTYSDKSMTDLRLTDHYPDVLTALDDQSMKFKGGATNIGAGILEGAAALSDKKLARPWATRMMIVLSDGVHNVGTDPLVAAQMAANQKIMVFTVTFSDEADIVTMQEVARLGGGKHFHVQTGTELIDAFEDIARSMPTLITF